MNHPADTRGRLARIRARTVGLAALLLTGITIGCVADPNSEQAASQPQGAEAQTQEGAEGQGPETPAPQSESSETRSPEAPSQESKSAENPGPKPPVPAPGESATGPAGSAKPPGQMVNLPPIQLLGMSRDDVIKELGKPVFQRRDRTALLLRYREGRCILDLFLYPRKPSGQEKAVDYIEARTDEGKRTETPPCVEAIRKAKTAG